jgi:hypothetical protein
MVAQVDSLYAKTRPLKLVSRFISYLFFEGRPVTTKGRWFNSIVFANLKVWAALPQVKEITKPIFILGAGRSGTTILGVLLSMHRDIGFLNEPKAMWHAILPAEDVGGSFNLSNAKYRLDASDADKCLLKRAHRIYGAYSRLVGCDRIVDKYPELSYRIPFVKAIFPDAKFIFLVRNGWETCSSISKWSIRHRKISGDEIHDWWGVNQKKWHNLVDQIIVPDDYFANSIREIREFRRQEDMAAVEWVATMRECLRLKERYGEALHILKYEDMVNSTDESLGKLLSYCELTDDERFVKYAKAVLRENTSHPKIELHSAIEPLFVETLREMGYS